MIKMCFQEHGTSSARGKLIVLVFNSSKKMVVDCYADADFAGLWGDENPEDHICARSRTGFVEAFSN